MLYTGLKYIPFIDVVETVNSNAIQIIRVNHVYGIRIVLVIDYIIRSESEFYFGHTPTRVYDDCPRCVCTV